MDRYRITPTCHTPLSPPQPTQSKPPPPPFSPSLFRLRRAGDAELGIFGAERYYDAERNISTANSKHPAALASTRPSSVSSVDAYGRIYRNGSVGTPTASSVESWNSHSGLLSGARGSVAVTIKTFPLKGPRKGAGAAYGSVGRRLFCRSCFCGGGKAIKVDEKFPEPKSPLRTSSVYGSSKQSIETMRTPTTNKEVKHEVGVEEETKVRITPGNWPKGDNFIHCSTLYYAKKPLLLAEIGRRMVSTGRGFDALRSPENVPSKDQLPAAAAINDAASDASSDLFELESFSAQRRQRETLDELLDQRRRLGAAAPGTPRRAAAAAAEESAASAAPSECAYAPSEASVVWSVATAEPPGLDRAGSARGETRFDLAERDRFRMSLLSCRSQKAISVGPGLVRFGPEPEMVAASEKVGELNSVRICGPLRPK